MQENNARVWGPFTCRWCSVQCCWECISYEWGCHDCDLAWYLDRMHLDDQYDPTAIPIHFDWSKVDDKFDKIKQAVIGR